jgi:hypothetical protein
VVNLSLSSDSPLKTLHKKNHERQKRKDFFSKDTKKAKKDKKDKKDKKRQSVDALIITLLKGDNLPIRRHETLLS